MTYKEIFEEYKRLLPSDTMVSELENEIILVSESTKLIMRETAHKSQSIEQCYKYLLQNFFKKGVEYYVNRNAPK